MKPLRAQHAPAQPAPRGRILSFSVPLRVARCPFVYHIDPSGMQALMIAIATPGQQGPDSVTHSGPASVGHSKAPTGQEHAPFKGPHDYARQELVAPPNILANLGYLRPQVAKLRALGFFWPDEMGDFLERKAQ